MKRCPMCAMGNKARLIEGEMIHETDGGRFRSLCSDNAGYTEIHGWDEVREHDTETVRRKLAPEPCLDCAAESDPCEKVKNGGKCRCQCHNGKRSVDGGARPNPKCKTCRDTGMVTVCLDEHGMQDCDPCPDCSAKPVQTVVRCHRCQGTVAYKRISDNEFEVYHGCEATDGGAREMEQEVEAIANAISEKWTEILNAAKTAPRGQEHSAAMQQLRIVVRAALAPSREGDNEHR